MNRDLKDRLVELVAAPLKAEECEMADLVLATYKRSTTVRFLVYTEGGVTLEQCERLSRIIGGVIDGTDYFPYGYTLEVSSPGLDRPLTTARDFRYRVGETVKIQFGDRARKATTAKIIAASDDEVTFENEAGEFMVRLTDIEKAKIIF